jgi:hypothetical protein
MRNGRAIVEKVWRSLLEVTQPNGVSSDHVLLEHLAKAVTTLNLPPVFLERLEMGVAEAIQRAWQHDQDRVVHLTVAALVLQVEGGQKAQSWGFFLVEKRLEHTADRRIEISLYPEGC